MKDGDYLRFRRQTVEICALLSEDEMSCQPRKEVSPPKWHLAHTTWFFEKVILEKFISDYKSYNPEYDYYFNSYYKQAGVHIEQSQRASIGLTVEEIISYREYVDTRMQDLLKTTLSDEVKDLVNVGFHHEQQHQELLHMDVKAVREYCGSDFRTQFPPQVNDNEEWLEISEGLKEFGHVGQSFSYDNEKPCHEFYMYPALIKKNLVRNIEYSEFISSKGYEDPKYWLSQGWDWVVKNKISKPLYWNNKLEANTPVAHISYFEADAFANWCGLRLPTEHELELFDREEGEMSPLWCWSSSQYQAYPRFKKFDGILSEYNGKFMCNQFVLRGGCLMTPKGHWRPSYRNFYEPQQRWMFSGIRLAKDVE